MVVRSWNAQLGGQRSGLPEQCMPLKLLHANAKAFEETESHRRSEHGPQSQSVPSIFDRSRAVSCVSY